MALKVTTPKRIFRYEGRDIPDPAPALSVERAVNLIAATEPELTNAKIEPGVPENGAIVHALKVAVGTKG